MIEYIKLEIELGRGNMERKLTIVHRPSSIVRIAKGAH